MLTKKRVRGIKEKLLIFMPQNEKITKIGQKGEKKAHFYKLITKMSDFWWTIRVSSP